MEQFLTNLASGFLGALVGAYVTIRINSGNRKVAAVEHMLALVYPLGFRSWWEPGQGKTALIFHENYPQLWEAQASLRAALPWFKRKELDSAWQKFMAIEYFNEIPNDQPSKIFQKGTYNTRDEAVQKSAEFLAYLNGLR
ncbi:MAG: hypothetical protein A2W76_02785 [Gammaproteobacteria bacterium RIFCSPLOWO2_12_47_11]|nr:MAG: hypothetical protein A2W76_02785 [Gammaproteobacteria bacterium RIFCSPLOWO2_12_47_11]